MGSYTGGHNADKRKTTKNQNGSAALGRPAMKLLGMASNEITLYQNSLNGSTPVNKMADRAKNLKTPTPPKPLGQFLLNFTGMLLSFRSDEQSGHQSYLNNDNLKLR